MSGDRALALLRRYRGGVAAAAVAVTLTAPGLFASYEHGLLESYELALLERFFELRGSRAPTAPIVIISIDESSFVELNEQWPFARATHARLIATVAAAGPLAIGMDVIFDQPSSRGPDDDPALGEAVAQARNVVLGAAPVTDQGFYTDTRLSYTRSAPNLPLPAIRRGAAGVGAINLPPDIDNHVRRAPRSIWTGTEQLPSLDIEVYRVATGSGLMAVALPAQDEILINFSGPPRTFPWVAYYQVVNGEVEPEFFRGKIVLIGPTSEPMHDIFATPFARGGDLMPGVEIHANTLDTYLSGNRVREVPMAVSTALGVVAAVLGAALVLRHQPLRAAAAVTLLALVVAVFTYIGFLYAEVWLRAGAGMLGLVLGYGITVVDNFVREQRERQRLSQFFSPEVLREVVRHRHEHNLGSSRRQLTVLFADIRGFTALSEKLEPEEVAEMLRDYLTEMTEVIFKHGGTVDKYIGDCVMALYNVPLEDAHHVRNAMHTALELQERTLQVSARWEARLGAAIRSGIGINTGEAVVGTMGSRQRLEYTAIGDTINLGSRLESLTKEHGVAIIISEFTQQHLRGEFLTRELGQVTVRGRTQPVKIYGVLPADIRKHPRAVLDIATTVTLRGPGQVCTVTARDVSEGGIALGGVPAAWTEGTQVEIRCEGGALPGPLLAHGLIAWRREDEAGITFSGIEPDAAATVAEYVARRRS
jgi:adenylate cyclase